MSDVAFIVLDIDGGAMLRDCLDSIRAQSVAPAEIVVLDNGSRTPLRLDDVRVLRSETNLGFAGGVNEAWRQTTAPLVAVINNDVVLDHDWLETLLRAFADDVGAAQTVIRKDDETIDGAGIDVSDGTIRQAAHGMSEEDFRLLPSAFCLSMWGVSATAALYRRTAVGERPFDPHFFAYYEDVELSARLHEGGWKTIVVGDVKATHRGSQSASILGSDALRLRTRNRYIVARMHPGAGRVGALFREDLKLLLRGRSSLRGMIEGVFGTSHRPHS